MPLFNCLNNNQQKTNTMQIKDCKIGTEVVLRGKIAGISADESSVRIETKEGSAMYYRPELLELVKPAEEIEAKDCTPDEACCCDPAPEQAPVTVEMIKEAYDRLEKLVDQCNTPVLLCMIAQEKECQIDHLISTNNGFSKMAGAEGIGWNAARGFLYATRSCFSCDPEAISQGIKYFFETLEKKKNRGVFTAIIDTPFEH